MRISLIIVFILSGSFLFGQNDSIERAILLRQLNDKQITQAEFARIYNAWDSFIKEYGKYPVLPVQKNGQVIYTFRLELPGYNRSQLVPRIREWLAINYGLFPANYYSSQYDGKVIYHNNFNLTANYSCSYVAVISANQGTMTIEFFNVFHHNYIPGHYLNDIWVPETTIDTSVDRLYPVIIRKSSEWKDVLQQIGVINNYFNTAANEFYRYIIRGEKELSFFDTKSHI